MIAAQDDRQLAAAHDRLHFSRERLARRADLRQIFRARVGWRVHGAFDAHVAEIAHVVAELCDALVEARDAHGGGAEIDARQRRAEAERHAEYADAPPRAR